MQLWKGNTSLLSHWLLWSSVEFPTGDVHEDHSNAAETFALIPLRQHLRVILYKPCKLNNTAAFLCHLPWIPFVPAVTPVVFHNCTSKLTVILISWHLLYKPVFPKTQSDSAPWTAASWKDGWTEDCNINYLYSTNSFWIPSSTLWTTAITVPCGFFTIFYSFVIFLHY